MNRFFRNTLAFFIAACLCMPVFAADPDTSYPSKPVKLLIPYPAGASTDLIARIISTRLSEVLGQQVLADNRGGGGGIIATEAAVRSPADGYTLLFGTSAGLVIAPLLHSKITYDPIRDLDPVGLVVTIPQLLVVNPSLPVNSVKELIDYAKRNPGKLFYASAGIGAPNHIATEWLKSLVGINMVHVPFKGIAQATPELIENRVQVLLTTITSVQQYLKNGKLKALAVTGARRATAGPEYPTMIESGVPGYAYELWYGIFAPARTPATIVSRLNAELVKMLATPEMAQSFAKHGAEPRSSTPADLSALMRTDIERLGKVIRSAGIKAE